MSTTLILDQSTCQQISQGLAKILADTYVLYVKTQNFHWNVIDPRFHSLHEMLDEQYHELAEAIDELAERIRMLKMKSPGSMQQFLELTSLNEADGGMKADLMLQSLTNDHEAVANELRPKIQEASEAGDEGTADLLIQRLRAHEKAAWMLRSHFPGNQS